VHAWCRFPGVAGDGPKGPHHSSVALDAHGDVGTGGEHGPHEGHVEEAGVGAHAGPGQARGQTLERRADQVACRRAGVVVAGEEFSGEGDAELGPGDEERPPRALAGVVVGHARLPGPVDLDVGRIGVEGDPFAQTLTLGGRQQGDGAGDRLGPGGLHPGPFVLAETGRQGGGGGGRRRHGDRPQRRGRGVGPGPVEVGQEVTPAQKALGEGHDELTGRQSPVPLLDRPHQGIDGVDETKSPHRLGHAHQTRRARQRRVIGTNHHGALRMPYGHHPTGAFRLSGLLASTPRILLQRKALVADGNERARAYLRIPV
jgi:hypothetical protein